jgi:hypothetical protein
VFPAGRYGRRRAPGPRRRGLGTLAAIIVVVLAVALAVRLYQQYGDPAYEPEVISYTDITDSQVVIRFRVHLPAGGRAVCAVRARAYDGATVGRAEVPVSAADPEVAYRLATTGRPFVGEVVRCRPAG